MNKYTMFIGPPKCATTSLYEMVTSHPGVDKSPVKETTHFTRDYHQGIDRFIAGRDYANIVDFQPNHCLIPFVPERIRESLGGDTNIIMVVREPIARAYSELCHFRGMRPGREDGDFNDIMLRNIISYDANKFSTEYEYMKQLDPRGGCYEHAYVERGVYTNHIKRFRGFCVSIVLFDDLISDHQTVLNSVFRVMGLSDHNVNLVKSNSKSDGGKFDDYTYSALRAFYKPFNDIMSNYLNRDLEEIWYDRNDI